MKSIRDTFTELRDEQTLLMTASLLILAATALGFVFYLTRSFMIPFVLSLFIASLVAPAVDYQVVKLRFPKWLAVATSLLIVAGVMTIFCLTIVVALQTVLTKVDDYSDQFVVVFEEKLVEISEWDLVHDLGFTIDTKKARAEVAAQMPHVATQWASFLFRVILNSALTGIFVAFLLAGRNSHRARKGIYAEVDQKVRQYIRTKVSVSALTGILVWLSLHLLGIELAPLFGLLAFLLNFIPSIGSIISTLLPLPIAIMQDVAPLQVIGAVAIPGAIQMTLGNVVEPKLMGDGLELHPATILLSLAFWGLIWGPVGMVLAVPITAVVRIVLVRFESTRPAGDLLAGRLPD